MLSNRIEQFIQEANQIPPLPHTVQKALAIMGDPEVNAASLANVLASDQVLSARALKWANSPYYGMENRVVTVQQAIVVLGLNGLRELIMINAVSDHLNQALPGYGLKRGELWHHALGTAIGAQLLSRKYHLRIDDEAYFAGLLCDIGKLIFEKHLRAYDLQSESLSSRSFLEVERSYFGIDHSQLGAEIARAWQLPESLVTAIAFHHEPQCALSHQVLTSMVHIADVSMKVLGIGMGFDGLRYPLEESALQCLRIGWDDLFALSDQVAKQLEHARKFINFDSKVSR